MQLVTRIAATVTAGLLFVGCTGGDDPPDDQPSALGGSTTTTGPSIGPPTPTTSSASPTPTPLEPLTISFVGDMNFERDIRARLDADPGTVFGPSRELLGSADLTIGNLETAIAVGGTPEPKTYTFRAPPSTFQALELAGFDAVSMANNHGVDFGAQGLGETLAAIDQTAVKVAGIGANAAEAYAPVILESKGRRVAVLAALDLRDETWQNWGATDASGGVARFDNRFLDAVRSADQQADVTIAYIHWAPENQPCPDPGIAPSISDQLIAAGADLVIGAHAHQLQGAGWKGRAFVAYGTGNYLWYVQNTEPSTRTGIFTVTLDANNDPVSYDYAPARIQPGGAPAPMAGGEADAARATLDELRTRCTDLAGAPSAP